MSAGRLEAAIEVALTTGLLVSAALLVVGLALPAPALLRWGLLILMLTPVFRVVVMTAGLFHARDFVFGIVSLVILGVLASSFFTAARLRSARLEAPPTHRAPGPVR